MKLPKNLTLANDCGLKISSCQPREIYAKVVHIRQTVIRNIDDEDPTYEHIESQYITFQYPVKDKKYHVAQRFNVGDVTPVMGQWVRGIVTYNQWGTEVFTTTHLMKEMK